jgi:undecaprenyl-diphosphatase
MDTLVAALIMGVVQGLTEFLPVSSSGHLILVPYLLGPYLPGMRDPFITSLEFSVMLHIGTLVALLLYFRSDWLRLVPAFFGAVRDRSLDGDPDRRLAALLAVATLPALVIGFLLHDLENSIRDVGPVAVTLVIGAAILWLAERTGTLRRMALDLSFAQALAIGGAQAIALIPGISRSGISISAGLFAGLRRDEAARFSFLMATPITAAAAAYELLTALRGEGVPVEVGPLVAGLITSFAFGMLAIAVLLRFLRTRSTNVFIAYRVVLAAALLILWLG